MLCLVIKGLRVWRTRRTSGQDARPKDNTKAKSTDHESDSGDGEPNLYFKYLSLNQKCIVEIIHVISHFDYRTGIFETSSTPFPSSYSKAGKTES